MGHHKRGKDRQEAGQIKRDSDGMEYCEPGQMTARETALYTIQCELIRSMSETRIKSCDSSGHMLNVTLTNNDRFAIDLRGDAAQIISRADRELYKLYGRIK